MLFVASNDSSISWVTHVSFINLQHQQIPCELTFLHSDAFDHNNVRYFGKVVEDSNKPSSKYTSKNAIQSCTSICCKGYSNVVSFYASCIDKNRKETTKK